MTPTTAYPEVLGRVFAFHRKRLALNQDPVAQAIGVSQSAYSRMERGETPITTLQLRKAARGLGWVEPSRLLEDAEKVAKRLSDLKVRVLDERPPNGLMLWLALDTLDEIVSESFR